MKFKTFLAGCLGGLLSLNSCTNSPDMTDYAAYVNPFIGTGGHGHTFPGRHCPHGMISPSPDTRIDGWMPARDIITQIPPSTDSHTPI